MGYRNYIASVPKKEYDIIKDFTLTELLAHKKSEDDYIGVYDIAEKQLYELGKYVELKGGEKFFEQFFTNEDLNDSLNEDGEFCIVNKTFLKHVIEDYSDKVKTFYRDLVVGIDDKYNIPQDRAYKLFEQVRNNATEWLQLTPFKLDKGEEITTSWKYEYAIFELVRIYKSFDWENDVMVYYGY